MYLDKIEQPQLKMTTTATTTTTPKTRRTSRLLGAMNMQDNNGDTPCHAAGKNENYEILGIFLNEGADFNIKNNNGKTVFDVIFDNIIENETSDDGKENKVAEKFKDWVLEFRSHREEVLDAILTVIQKVCDRKQSPRRTSKRIANLKRKREEEETNTYYNQLICNFFLKRRF